MNRLAKESSPYLLQHADNPVDWYPWGEEAFKKAIDEDKPIFLSIGYSACHWCHVMEHECFENDEIADIMNRHFVNIKVDREERPDIDEIYQTACQLITGTGGWPLSAFLTPELKPFYVGTYFPPNDRYGIPGFVTILNRIKDIWINNRDHFKKQAENIFKRLLEIEEVNINGVESIDRSILDEAAILLLDNADHVNGGFDSAPKFPNTTLLTFLLEYYKLSNYTRFKNFVLLTLDKMSQGGIYDQIGGGFHRYSTDSKWLIPHFEKMLYDNALIPIVYCEAYQLSNEYRYLRIAKDTLDYVIREMLSNEGGFYSTQDADSEGIEGKYYTFTYDEIYNLFGEDKANIISSYYGITKVGNFEGRNVLHVANSKESIARRFNKSIEEIEGIIEECRKVLLIEREKRVKPFRDEKIITSWNSLMISAFLKYYSITSDMGYFMVGKKALDFISNKLSNTNYELKRIYKDGKSYIDAFLDDYAFYIKALLDMFKVSKEDRYLNYAIEYVRHVIEEFTLELYYTSDKHTGVIMRKRHIYDLSIPSPTSFMAYNFLLLYKYTGEKDYLEKASGIIKRYARLASENPFAFGSMLNAIYFYLTINES